MAYSVSADPERFEEALAWFRDKLAAIVTREQWDQLGERAKRRAFFVSGISRIDVIQTVWDHVQRSIDDGRSFADFAAEASQALSDTWLASDGVRLETIFRNNVQSAYAAGRYQQQTTPDALRQHPVWQFDAILDSRTTEVCGACNGAVRPANDPWWNTHIPPLHHRCRSGVITLSADDAAKLGGVTDAPEVVAQEGWGAAPSADEWRPDPGAYAPELRPAVERLLVTGDQATAP